MKKYILFLFLFSLCPGFFFAQVSVTTDGSNPDNSAMLDVKSIQAGFLPPRMSLAQRDAIEDPPEGLMVFCTNCGYYNSSAISIYINGHWRLLMTNCPLPNAPVEATHVVSAAQIIWNWNPVPGATGYKFNTINDYTSAEDLLTGTTKTETDISPGTHTRYIWAYNNCGNSTATAISATIPFSIGQEYGGGIIFYIDGTGQHGLISAPFDQGIYEWGCGGYWDCIYIGAIYWGIGMGQTNTTLIVNGCGSPSSAARICNNLVLNEHDDWFLPSMSELALMRQLKSIIGGFVEGQTYYSSTEFSCTAAFGYYMIAGTEAITISKYQGKYVRAIRAF